jgi:SAM-dependent methyltransferase
MPDTSNPPVARMVHHCCDLLRQRLDGTRKVSGLVVGCGSGNEVVYMRRTFRHEHLVGVDVTRNFSPAARAEQCVARGDARHLPFPAETFDFAAAFHSLEHVGDPRLALDEIHRVLRAGAWFYLGVPNSRRLLGYLGSFDATAWQKITWNLADWVARVRGEFRNESGAHAGFERRELAALLQERFTNVQLLTEEFLRYKYGGSLPRFALQVLLAPSIMDYSAPAHYAICRKRG